MGKIKVYSKDDWVVHVSYGVGQVKGIERKRTGGIDTLYYRVEGDNTTFWLPVSQADTERVRPVVSKSKLQMAIQTLKDRPRKMDTNHKIRQIRIKDVRSKGSLIPLACLVRDMSYGETKKRLSITEQDVLTELKKRLAMEWAVVLDIQPQEARNRLDKLLLSHAE